MQLDRATCRRARLARDARFDGRFFVGVRTTGVFCRPVCPAVAPAERNVEYLPSAAAAVDAGFRACLRCRPECAPGTPGWAGVSTTVGRALRLIGEGALEDAGVDGLAARLGVGDRHLRRLFVEHLGATPIAVAQTLRLLSAKRLIDETDLPLTDVAMSAGYGSVRRFNAAFLSSYGRSPRELRMTDGRRTSRARTARYGFQLRYRPPFDWQAMLAFLGRRAIPGVEIVEHGAYRRTIEIDGTVGVVHVSSPASGALQVEIDFPRPAQLLRIVARIRRVFDLDADPMAIDAHLARDPLLAPLVRERPGLRFPGAWDGFETGVRAILGQQISVAAARTLAGRLVVRFGRSVRTSGSDAGEAGPPDADGLTHVFPGPGCIAAASGLAGVGLPSARAETIRRFAAAVDCGDIRFGGELDGDVFRERLRGIRGIGQWTADYMALRALGDPDAFPSADLGLLRASGARTPAELARRAEAWRPWRAYAAVHLWEQG